MPEPTKTPSAPSCIIIAASAGVAMPPAVNSTTGSLPASATSLTSSYGACSSLAATYSSSSRIELQPADLAADRAHVRRRVGDVTGAGLALGADHRRALGDPAQRLAEVGRAADEGHGELPLVDVVGVVGRGEHLGLVDVVDAEATAAPAPRRSGRSGPWPSPGSRPPSMMPSIMSGSLIRDDAALGADVGGHALERHHGDGAGVLGDLGLLGVDDVHDHAALEHLGHAALDARGAGRGLAATGAVRRRTSGPTPDRCRVQRRNRAVTRHASWCEQPASNGPGRGLLGGTPGTLSRDRPPAGRRRSRPSSAARRGPPAGTAARPACGAPADVA